MNATWLSRRWFGLVVVAMSFAVMAPAVAAAQDNPRRALVKEYDYNGDKRLKGKEARHLRKEKPARFERLQDFCEVAKESPKKHDVRIPADTKAKKVKCKKGRIDQPYLRAWMDVTDDKDETPARKHPQHR